MTSVPLRTVDGESFSEIAISRKVEIHIVPYGEKITNNLDINLKTQEWSR